MRAEFAGALMLLTRLPAGWLGRAEPPPLARCLWAFPLVGAVVGGIGAAVFWAGERAGLPPALAAIWTLAATMLATGALHEDGLADTADGFGGGRSTERKLEIMRDSRIGAYGALALILFVAVRGAALAALGQPARVAAALVATAALARGGVAIPLLLLRPARVDGLASALATPGRAAWVALALGVAVAALVLPWRLALGAAGASGAAVLVLAWLAKRQIGGFSGDVLGAGVLVAECAALSVLAAGWRIG
ncbi:MAG: adenosylcobinamide-GDP ribazoletransferase [Acetobacteraceae bacterium]